VNKREKFLMIIAQVDGAERIPRNDYASVLFDAAVCILDHRAGLLLNVVLSGLPNMAAPRVLQASSLYSCSTIVLPGIELSEGQDILLRHAPQRMSEALEGDKSLLKPLVQCVGRTPRLLEILLSKARLREEESPQMYVKGELEAFSVLVEDTVAGAKQCYPRSSWERILHVGYKAAVAGVLSLALEGKVVRGSDTVDEYMTIDQFRSFGILNLVPSGPWRGSYLIELPLVMLRAILELFEFEVPSGLLCPSKLGSQSDFGINMCQVRMLRNTLYLNAGTDEVSLGQLYPGALGRPETLSRRVGISSCL
jgi:hypothetical protein